MNLKEIKEKNNNEYNSLSKETRQICSVSSCFDLINGMRREKRRLIARFKASLSEITSHINNIEEWICERENK